MNKINWPTRIKHPAWWLGMLSVAVSPILAYNGASLSDFTTWESIWDLLVEFIKNPYLLGSVVMAVLGALGVTVDHTTAGIPDSQQALEYTCPRKEDCDAQADSSD